MCENSGGGLLIVSRGFQVCYEFGKRVNSFFTQFHLPAVFSFCLPDHFLDLLFFVFCEDLPPFVPHEYILSHLFHVLLYGFLDVINYSLRIRQEFSGVVLLNREDFVILTAAKQDLVFRAAYVEGRVS